MIKAGVKKAINEAVEEGLRGVTDTFKQEMAALMEAMRSDRADEIGRIREELAAARRTVARTPPGEGTSAALTVSVPANAEEDASDIDDNSLNDADKIFGMTTEQFERAKHRRASLVAKIAARRKAEAEGSTREDARRKTREIGAAPETRGGGDSGGLFGGASAVEEAALRQKLSFDLGESLGEPPPPPKTFPILANKR